MAKMGEIPISSGELPATCVPAKRAIGFSPWASAHARRARIVVDAPSEIWDLFVLVDFFVKYYKDYTQKGCIRVSSGAESILQNRLKTRQLFN